MANYLMIHGASHGGWCWNKVKNILESMGHNVIAPDLPGHEVNSLIASTEITMARYVEFVKDIIKGIEGKVILVGHSMGGAIITQVIDDLHGNNIDKAYYVCAFIPNNGDVVGQLLKEDTNSQLRKTFKINQENMTVELIPELIGDIMYNGCSLDDIEYAIQRIIPEPILPIETPLRIVNRHELRCIGIVCKNDKSLTPEFQEKMYSRAGFKIEYLDSGHAPFFSKPDELSKILSSE